MQLVWSVTPCLPCRVRPRGHSPWRAVQGDAAGQRSGRPQPRLRAKCPAPCAVVTGTTCSVSLVVVVFNKRCLGSLKSCVIPGQHREPQGAQEPRLSCCLCLVYHSCGDKGPLAPWGVSHTAWQELWQLLEPLAHICPARAVPGARGGCRSMPRCGLRAAVWALYRSVGSMWHSPGSSASSKIWTQTVPGSCLVTADQGQHPGPEFGIAGALGKASCRDSGSEPAHGTLDHWCSRPWEPGASLLLRGDSGKSRITGASPSRPQRRMPTGTGINVCSTTVPYRQPLPVFARPLRPLGSQTAAPPGQGAHGAGSARPGSPSASDPAAAPGDGGR